MTTDLAELLGTRESAGLEFKRTAKKPDVIRRAICAMANDLARQGGGDLLIGVDDNGEPADEVDTSDRALLALTDMREDGLILDRPSTTVTVEPFKGKPVIRIRVEASAAPPVRFDGVVWVRPGPTTRRATRDDERVLTVEAGGFREQQRPDYPFDALRELCMNAIMHRNYETSYAPTRIAWFEDRIEVTNPGGPYGQVRSDNFDRVNDYRNPSLAAAMKSLGYVNRFGRGIGRVRASLQRNGNPPAEFLVDQSSWFVTVRRAQ
ncbi:putative DNA binding domain-containing protein [Kitasatospora sp. RB6PN24]|uniref:ATP-binding protein n=1 Tax=Kitasatospora humi TaxID=2893891 RepID=UPI001E36E359|nr:ATP-binding protein [Kitasatospora humi]MCC9307584.1 putative DNA binding domain-containing protein [Kitasatospora humi]